MQIADHPAEIHVAHNVFHGGERPLRGGGITHGQPDAREQLIDQHHQGKDAEEIPDIEVPGRIIATHVGVPRAHDGQASIDPVTPSDKCIQHGYATSGSTPTTSTDSPSKE